MLIFLDERRWMLKTAGSSFRFADQLRLEGGDRRSAAGEASESGRARAGRGRTARSRPDARLSALPRRFLSALRLGGGACGAAANAREAKRSGSALPARLILQSSRRGRQSRAACA